MRKGVVLVVYKGVLWRGLYECVVCVLFKFKFCFDPLLFRLAGVVDKYTFALKKNEKIHFPNIIIHSVEAISSPRVLNQSI